MNEAVKAGIVMFLQQNNVSLIRQLFLMLENQKSEYAVFGQEGLLHLLTEGKQIACQSTLVQTNNKRIVFQSFLRLEDMTPPQQNNVPASQ